MNPNPTIPPIKDLPNRTGNALPNIPWQERPSGNADIVWRYNLNPIIPRDLIPSSNSIINSAVVPFHGKFAGVFRCDNKKREMNLNRGFSDDGIHWKWDNETIHWECDDPDLHWFQYRYDPRVVWLEHRYYVTWCNGYHDPTIGIGYTYGFERFTFLENALLPFNLKGVLFPRKIRDRYVMFSRPGDNGHTPFGDIYLSQSPDMVHWGEQCVGDVPNVAFSCATLYDEPSCRIAIYYGGADTATALAFARLDEVLDFLKTNSEL